MKFQKGQKVKWSWGEGEAKGVIQKSYKKKVSRTIKGTEVVRDATEENPAYLIEQDDGDEVLKSESEIEKA